MKQKDKCGCVFEHTEHGSYLIKAFCSYHIHANKYTNIDGVNYKVEI